MLKHISFALLVLGACVASPAPTDNPDGDSDRQITHGVGMDVPPELTLATPEGGFEWCTPASPHVAESKSIWCQMCNKKDAEDCARQWAISTSNDECATKISSGGGTSACAPDSYTGDICVDDTSSGITSEVQVGSDTACGVWPFRHAAWKVTYNVTGNCGWTCRSD